MPKYKNRREEVLEIDSIGFEGVSIARLDGKVVFVKHAVPGDKVVAEVRKNRKKFMEGTVKEILEPSKDRIEPKCEHFTVCGGCSWQMLSYQDQVAWKKQHLIDSFERIGGLKGLSYEEPLFSKNEFQYRNKMEFSFGASRWMTAKEIDTTDDIQNKDFALGLHIPGRFDKILDINYCHIQQEFGNELLKVFRDKALSLGVTAYNTRDQVGFLRNLMIRYAAKNNQFMIVLMTRKPTEIEESLFLDWFKIDFPQEYPDISEIYHAVKDSSSPTKIDDLEIIRGEGYITEEILGIDYRISPFSFFQTNSGQLNPFISEIVEKADLDNESIVWDLYCGTGSITLPASKKAKKVIGIELVESSIKDANVNADLNNIDNVEFHSADLHKKEIPNLLDKLDKPDVLILDPPRAGVHKNLIFHLMELEIPRIVYVSCNPATQARDCSILAEKYEIKNVKPVDMFPQTYHVESIAVLELK